MGTLLGVPRAKGLFRRAIVESGGGQHVTRPATAKRIGERFAQLANVPASREAVAGLSTAEIIAAQDALRAELLTRPEPAFWGEVLATGLPWQPTIDGDVLPALPLDAVRDGASEDVDLLLGEQHRGMAAVRRPRGPHRSDAAGAAAGALAGFG